MSFTPIVTTSWDDGHPLDLRLADRLDHYGIAATFYIPRQSQLATLGEDEIGALSERFEIGGHTLDHLALTTLSDDEASRQIVQCKAWIEKVTKQSCEMFCPPLGKFNATHVAQIADAGYLGFRTVELLQTSPPQRHVSPRGVSESHRRAGQANRPDEVWAMPTTLQSHPHDRGAYLRNAFKRKQWATAISALSSPSLNDWAHTAQRMIERVVRQGGVFHLWGHSWEIEENDQWKTLDRVLGRLSDRVRRGELRSLTNSQVCSEFAARS